MYKMMHIRLTNAAQRSYPLLFFVFLAVMVLLAGCSGKSGNSGDAAETQSSNIIYILADDLGYGDIGPFGQTKIQTPHLDRMATEGLRFTQHYSGSTVCASSRSVLMTGLHTGHTPIRGNREHQPIGQYPLPYAVTTVAEVLKEAGYNTGAFGKWGLGYPGSEGSPSRQGFDEFFGYNGQRRAHFYYPEFLIRERRGKVAERVPLEGNLVDDVSPVDFQHPGSGPPKTRGIYSQDAIMKEALSFLDRNAESGNPFFLYLPLNIPHASLTVPDSALTTYLDEQGESIFSETPFPGDHYSAQPRPKATYAGMVTLLDRYVGRVLDRLREKGIAENTLVIFTSDNGPHVEAGHDPEFFDSNGPLRGVKRDLYEGGIRVPMIAWWPGTVEAGGSSEHISAFEDMLPTAAELAGAQLPPGIDGISMAPTLTGRGVQQRHEHLYWEYPARGGKQAVRQGRWKAVRLGTNEDPDGPLELYNLQEDPGEQQNVAERHPDIVHRLSQIMGTASVPSEAFRVR